jgi:hypothetical protein
LPNWRNGSAPAYGAGGCGFDPHVGLGGSRSSVGRSSASHAEGPGFDPLRELVISRKVERSIRPENSSLYSFVRYGVVGNMSGSHPVASGSIPGIGWVASLVLLAQLAEHPLNIQFARGRGIDTPNLHVGGLAQMVERSLSS